MMFLKIISLYLERHGKPGIWQFSQKNLKFANFEKKNLEKPGI